jgi:CubicO group peptidase (beta-lactamase class C family)
MSIETRQAPVMQGVPPTRESQVTLAKYRVHPYCSWAFRNAGAPLNGLMIPRSGEIRHLEEALDPKIGETLDPIFEEAFADGILVTKDARILHERYFNGLTRDYQHIWFSATKSLTSTAFGILVDEGRVDLNASPADYIPELKGSGFERVTIQNVLDHSSGIDFHENYTDESSDFLTYYAPAGNMGYMPGARDANPDTAEVYGIHDFLSRFVKPDLALQADEAFDYNSANADVIGWLIARISGEPFDRFVQQHIWAKIGAEHDAFMACDRAYQGVATGGMNTTLRDMARFGTMILNRGEFNGQRIVSQAWVDATLQVSQHTRDKMANNPKYHNDPWAAYHNMWWILDTEAGEYCANGIHGQVIYINRSRNVVITFVSSQPVASAAGYEPFWRKLKAVRQLAGEL